MKSILERNPIILSEEERLIKEQIQVIAKKFSEIYSEAEEVAGIQAAT